MQPGDSPQFSCALRRLSHWMAPSWSNSLSRRVLERGEVCQRLWVRGDMDGRVGMDWMDEFFLFCACLPSLSTSSYLLSPSLPLSGCLCRRRCPFAGRLPAHDHGHRARQRHPAHRRRSRLPFTQGRLSSRLCHRPHRRDPTGQAAQVRAAGGSRRAREAGEPAAQQLGEGPVREREVFFFFFQKGASEREKNGKKNSTFFFLF